MDTSFSKKCYHVEVKLIREVPNKNENYTNIISTTRQSIVRMEDYESAKDMINIMTRDIDLKDSDEIIIKIVRF